MSVRRRVIRWAGISSVVGVTAVTAATAVTAQEQPPSVPEAASPQASSTAPPGPSTEESKDKASTPRFSGSVQVMGQSPLGGGLTAERSSAVVESAVAADIAFAQPIELSDFLTSRLTTVVATDTQGNPFERDLMIRGFTASPVLGTPEGIALYQDGVRLNEPFGDTIDWDLIPLAAVSRLELVPGSSPIFGLNAEGGTLVLDTKTGVTDPGLQGAIRGGSFGTHTVDGSVGRSRGAWSGLVAGDTYNSDSWREHSPSTVGQMFADVGWAGDRGSIDGSATESRSRLAGNGATPADLLALDPNAVFTFPDAASRDALLVATRTHLLVGPTSLLEGNLYLRRIVTSTVNGDATSYTPCAAPGQGGLLCDGDDPVSDQNGQPVPVGNPPLNGVLNNTRLHQDAYGGSFQTVRSNDLWGRHNEVLAGVSGDFANALFNANSELGFLTPDRDTVGAGLVTQDSLIRVDTRLDRAGVFVNDTYVVRKDLTLNVGGRFDAASLQLRDQLGGELSGNHSYSRLNPQIGLTYALTESATLRARYAQSSRAPNPVELTCSDPTIGCRLPSDFVADPPLAQVITRTGELSAEGRFGGSSSRGHASLEWNLALYRADSANDILFINSGRLIGQGFFANVGTTRRQGVDVGLRGAVGEHFRWYADGSLTDARFETPFLGASPENPFAAPDGTLPVPRGARIPLIPRYNVKTGFDVGNLRWRAGLDFLYLSPEFLRGDEANLNPPLPGQELVAFIGRLALTKRLSLTAKITNLLNRQLDSFGTFGDATAVLGASASNPRFLVPVAPRAFLLGLELSR